MNQTQVDLFELDELAREGSTTDLVGPEPALPLTRFLVMSIICEKAHQKRIKYWKNLPKCRHSKFFLKEPLMGAEGRRFLSSCWRHSTALIADYSKNSQSLHLICFYLSYLIFVCIHRYIWSFFVCLKKFRLFPATLFLDTRFLSKPPKFSDFSKIN